MQRRIQKRLFSILFNSQSYLRSLESFLIVAPYSLVHQDVGKLQHQKQQLQNHKQTSLQLKEPESLTILFVESEAAAYEVFGKSRGSSLCVIFFDELDSIAKARGGSFGEAS
ncbi:MAG: hypothetical protein EZS28_029854 [Streblomastix strix]|uniref:ATPase AAA-type core domain-containing protein n=1 Tax=Streblomastix strix TaxID=222440 RepID=A0A5J4UVZ3_9EUKA|nr:MAG: hypothetical protein EZS28_029854 [Streblomastix strix]